MISRFIIFFLICSYTGLQVNYIDKTLVESIELINQRDDNRYPKHLEFNNQYTISPIIVEINNLKPIDEVAVRSNYGDLYLNIKMKDSSVIHFIITYTVYNGVVITGQDQSLLKAYSKYYKNDRLEQILYYFLNHSGSLSAPK